jgi:HD-like signal output (HDOD) protein
MLAKLPSWQFDVIARLTESTTLQKGEVLLERGSDDGYTYYLVDGAVSLVMGNGSTTQVEACDRSRQMPLANLRPRILTVTATSRTHAIRVPDIALRASGCFDNLRDARDIEIESEEEAERHESQTRLSFQLLDDLISDRAILPTLPDLAMRIRRAIEEEQAAAKSIAKLVEADPAMAAKLLKVANSAFYGGMQTVETCSAAVVRMGLKTTKQLVLSFALREVFKGKNPIVKDRMQKLWKHSSNIAAISYVLARRLRKLDPEEALLAGLLHDIGNIAILNYLENYPALVADESAVDGSVERLRGELGAMILREWNFPVSLVAASRDAEHWLRGNDGAIDYTDLVIVAQVHERLRKHQLDGLPPLEQITAMRRVLGADATPEESVEILHEAKEQIDEMRSLLRG